jgi:hypothetical protein
MAITHPFVSGIADGADASLVRPSNWNAAHAGTATPDAHDIVSLHTYTGGAALDVFGLSAPNTIARLTPSSNPGAAAAILATDAAGGIIIITVQANNYTGADRYAFMLARG